MTTPGGKFITFEGGEGAGKSTQAKRLADFLRQRGVSVVLTREVGGCPSAEDIRHLWLAKKEGHWDPMTELLLVMAARREHLVKTVWPALERGAWVVCDRFVDSTRAYQGVGLGLGLGKVDEMYRAVAGDFLPDLSLLLDLPVDAGLARMVTRAGPDDRYQQRDAGFHQTLRDAYLSLARSDPRRVKIIDAERGAIDVQAAIQEAVAAHFALDAP